MAVAAAVVAVGSAGAEGGGRGRGCRPGPFAHCAGADLAFADLHGRDLRGADLRGARLGAAYLHGADLRGADLRGADLRGTDLGGADLRGTRLAGADLADAVLSAARLDRGALDGAVVCHTELPRGGTADRSCGEAGAPRPAPARARIDLAAARATGAADAAGAPARALASSTAGSRAGSAHPRRVTRRRTGHARAVKLTVRLKGPGRVRGTRAARALRCPRRCATRVRRRARAVLVARPRKGAAFAGWRGGGCRGKARRCRLRPRRATRVVARFRRAAAPQPPAPSKTPAATPGPGPAPAPPAGGCRPGADTDHDGLPDCRELAGWTFQVRTPADLTGTGQFVPRKVTSDPDNPDTDGDGVGDDAEFRFNGDPRSADTDEDGLGDRAEFETYHSDLNDSDTDNDSKPPNGGPRDARLDDGNEALVLHTNPRNPDTDGDGLSDFYETILGGTNPRVADLPQVELVGVPGQSNVQVDLGYTVTESTGTKKESASSTQTSASQTRSDGGSTETTNAISQAHEVGGACHFGTSDGFPDAGCEAHYNYTNTQTDSTSKGTTWGFDNTSELTEENQRISALSAERTVTFDPSGCVQVLLRVHNSGPVAVTIDDFQVLATIPDPDHPHQSKLLATLLPVSGEVYTSDCPATDSNFGHKTIPPSGKVDIGFSQQVEAQVLREYIAKPTPIKFSLGAISMTGTDLAGKEVNFLGDVATKVKEQDASIQVDFGEGDIENFAVAAGTLLNPDGSPQGVTLGEALGPELGDFHPTYAAAGAGGPSGITSLVSRQTGRRVTENPTLHAYWNLVGSAAGIGSGSTDWRDLVLRPGDAISLSYERFSDSDKLSDAAEALVGTDPTDPDTDGDGLDDDVEVRQGWVVPMARDGKSSYRTHSDPLSCDADGDKSPDGPGPGNKRYGLCPTGQGPESTRAVQHAGDPLEGTDPNRADTNGDNLLDGAQPYPDVLKAVPKGGAVPVFLRQWGGKGTAHGAFNQARDIAVDPNTPLIDAEGKLNKNVAAFVVNRTPAGGDDVIEKFTGNPLAEIPAYEKALEPTSERTLGTCGHEQNKDLTMGAVGLAVATGSVQNPEGPNKGIAGSPVLANFYPKDSSQPLIANSPDAFLTTFNGTTGEDLFYLGDGHLPGNASFCYGAISVGPPQNEYFSPRFPDVPSDPTTPETDAGRLALAAGNTPVIAHGHENPSTALEPSALPTEYLANESAEERRPIGTKPKGLTRPTEAGQIINPTGIAVDRTDGKLYVADSLAGEPGNSITKFDIASGEVEAFVADVPQLEGLRGLAVDPDGTFLYAVAGEYVYKLRAADLAILSRFGGPGSTKGNGGGAMTSPWDVDVDSTHGVWVTDAATDLVQFFYYP